MPTAYAQGDRDIRPRRWAAPAPGERVPALRADRLDGGTPISLREPKRPTVLLDDLDDSLVSAYNALPERAFAIDAKGRIAWRSAHGPRGLDLGELATAIESLVQAAR